MSLDNIRDSRARVEWFVGSWRQTRQELADMLRVNQAAWTEVARLGAAAQNDFLREILLWNTDAQIPFRQFYLDLKHACTPKALILTDGQAMCEAYDLATKARMLHHLDEHAVCGLNIDGMKSQNRLATRLENMAFSVMDLCEKNGFSLTKDTLMDANGIGLDWNDLLTFYDVLTRAAQDGYASPAKNYIDRPGETRRINRIFRMYDAHWRGERLVPVSLRDGVVSHERH